MLMLIVILTVIYQLLPTKQQSADIRVAVCCDDHDGYIEKVFAELERNNTLYKFYMVDDVDDVINVEAGTIKGEKPKNEEAKKDKYIQLYLKQPIKTLH